MKKRYIKLILIVLTICICSLFTTSVNAYSNTGYRDFNEIYLPENKDIYLLVNTSRKYRNENINKVPWKFFGPSVYVRHNKVLVGYKKHDVFTRSNKTSNALEYEYTYTTTLKYKINTENKYSKSSEAGIKVDFVTASIEESISNLIGTSMESTITTELNYTITVDPYTKVTVYLTGEALLSQGGAIYYIFGIPIMKMNWEYIDILTEYYEFYEETYH